MGQNRPFCLFSFFSQDKYSTNFTVNDKSIDGMHGTRTQGSSRMVGADLSTKLGRVLVHKTLSHILTFA